MPDTSRYTVIASIDRRDRRRHPDPFVVDGHQGRTGRAGRGAARTVILHLWATDASDAAEQMRRAHPLRPINRPKGLLCALAALRHRAAAWVKSLQAHPGAGKERR